MTETAEDTAEAGDRRMVTAREARDRAAELLGDDAPREDAPEAAWVERLCDALEQTRDDAETIMEHVAGADAVLGVMVDLLESDRLAAEEAERVERALEQADVAGDRRNRRMWMERLAEVTRPDVLEAVMGPNVDPRQLHVSQYPTEDDGHRAILRVRNLSPSRGGVPREILRVEPRDAGGPYRAVMAANALRQMLAGLLEAHAELDR